MGIGQSKNNQTPKIKQGRRNQNICKYIQDDSKSSDSVDPKTPPNTPILKYRRLSLSYDKTDDIISEDDQLNFGFLNLSCVDFSGKSYGETLNEKISYTNVDNATREVDVDRDPDLMKVNLETETIEESAETETVESMKNVRQDENSYMWSKKVKEVKPRVIEGIYDSQYDLEKQGKPFEEAMRQAVNDWLSKGKSVRPTLSTEDKHVFDILVPEIIRYFKPFVN